MQNIFKQRLEQLKQQSQQENKPAYYFQERALECIEFLEIDKVEDKEWKKSKKGSIFRAFKRNPHKAEAVYRYMKDMEKKQYPALYFLKLMNL